MQKSEMLSGRSVSDGRRFWVSKAMVRVVGLGMLAILAGLAMMVQTGWRVKAAAAAQVGKGVKVAWKAAGETARKRQVGKMLPAQARIWKLDEAVLQGTLEQAPMKGGGALEGSAAAVFLPLPDGRFERFRIEEASVMKPELAAQFPEIKTYRGWGVDNPALTMRCDWSPEGFHAMVTDGAELMAIHPVSRDDREHYVSYAARDYRTAAEEARCLVNEAKVRRRVTPSAAVNSSVGAQFRDYDIAIATTGEYAAAYGGMTSLNTWVNELNLIFDRELAIGFTLVNNNQQLVYTNAATDPLCASGKSA